MNYFTFFQEVGATVADYYVDYFDVEYPLPKLDMAAIPDYSSGATEHWGLITYRETNLVRIQSRSFDNNDLSFFFNDCLN